MYSWRGCKGLVGQGAEKMRVAADGFLCPTSIMVLAVRCVYKLRVETRALGNSSKEALDLLFSLARKEDAVVSLQTL
jgi:hypothetical protein